MRWRQWFLSQEKVGGVVGVVKEVVVVEVVGEEEADIIAEIVKLIKEGAEAIVVEVVTVVGVVLSLVEERVVLA